MKIRDLRALPPARPLRIAGYQIPEPRAVRDASGVREKPGRLRVLVVDDERAMLETTMVILQSEFEVVGTTRPWEGLRMLQSSTFHVLVTDWLMPSLDGMELSRMLFRLDLPMACLVMTGYMEELSEESFETRRLLGVLSKPYEPTKLLERVRELGTLAAMEIATRQQRRNG